MFLRRLIIVDEKVNCKFCLLGVAIREFSNTIRPAITPHAITLRVAICEECLIQLQSIMKGEAY